MIPKIWESSTFEWEGRFWSVPPREVLPKPYQKPHPPIWVAALQPATYQLAAQKGIGVMALGINAPSVLEPYIKTYREEIKNAQPVGGAVNNQWLSSCFGFCGEDNKQAQELCAKSLKTFSVPEGPTCKTRKTYTPVFLSSGAEFRTTLSRTSPASLTSRPRWRVATVVDPNCWSPWTYWAERPGTTDLGGVRRRHHGREGHHSSWRPRKLHQSG